MAHPLDDLAANPLNPRAPWRDDQLQAFAASLRRFGDLGGIVRNRTSGQLVGGHKRIEAFRAATDVQIESHTQDADAQGTVAYGYVLADGLRFSYREVQWDAATESAANLAANRWGAEWDWQRVSEALQLLAVDHQDLIAIAGFDPHELDTLLVAEWQPDAQQPLAERTAGAHPHTITLSPEQHAILQRAKAAIRADEGSTDTDDTLTDGRVIELVCAEFLAGIG